ncbi:MAG: ABC transporter permease, partial [Proteobacteria bacterium]|nr:ABC transporter permease [Pseudomonadota bacterium]
MNLLENIKEGFRTVKANLLRAILTALIIAIGITSLVGILTAIDSMEHAITGSFSELGANAFDIRSKGYGRRHRHQGKSGKIFPPVDLLQARAFKKQYDFNSKTSVYTYISQIAEIKSLSRVKGGSSRKTNPNVSVIGIDENFLDNKDYDLLAGRNFSNIELKYGSNVAIIGDEIANVLFEVDLGETGKSDGKAPP